MERSILKTLCIFAVCLFMATGLFADKLDDLGLDRDGKPKAAEPATSGGLTAIMDVPGGYLTLTDPDFRFSRDAAANDKAEAIINLLISGKNNGTRITETETVFPAGTKLVSLDIDDRKFARILIKFPDEFISDPGKVENSYERIVSSVIKSLNGLDLVSFEILAVEPGTESGAPLDSFLPVDEYIGPDINPDSATAPPQPENEGSDTRSFPHLGDDRPVGALSGKTVYMNPGHGWTWRDSDYWGLQRGFYQNNIEDFSNTEFINQWLFAYCYNAGADVFSVREMDPNTNMVVVDNDDGAPDYVETGTWSDSTVTGYENGHIPFNGTRLPDGGDAPFSFGTNRLVTCATGTPTASATYIPTIPADGWYNVYVSHAAFSNRSPEAHYTVFHAGGETDIRIDQRRRRSTWIPIGNFYFDAGRNPDTGKVVLYNDSTSTAHYVSTDAVRFGGGMGVISRGTSGVSGKDRFTEDARYNTQFAGYPDYGGTSSSTDESAGWSHRPRFGRWLKQGGEAYGAPAEDSVFVSSHTNGFNGTAHGLDTYVYTGYEDTWHDTLRDYIHDEVLNDLYNGYSATFVNHGTGKRFGSYGEANPSNVSDLMPIFLGEWLFHDSPVDMALYHDPMFRRMMARSIYQGIVKFWANRNGTLVYLLPEPPENFTAVKGSTTSVTLSWDASPVDSFGGDAATNYKVHQSEHGRGFPPGTDVGNVTTTTITDLTPGETYYFYLTATNTGGESFPTEVLAVKLPAAGGAPRVLAVSGFDKMDTSTRLAFPNYSGGQTLYRQFVHKMNTRDYIVEYMKAIDNYAYDVAVDSCEHDALDTLVLDDYDAIIWIGGIQAEVSTSDPTQDTSLTSAQRTQLQTYMENGGQLFISGSEIAWDLDRFSSSTFVDAVLKANYSQDDADTYLIETESGSIFDGLSSFNIDDGTGSTYNVQWPDVITPTGGSTAALIYGGAGAGDVFIDNFDNIGSWQDPNYSGQTNADSASTFTIASSPASEGSGSGRLHYVWGSGDYIREYNSGPTSFPHDSVISLDIYGDSSGHEISICLRDSENDLFLRDWITVSWSGWQTFTWDLVNDNINVWVQNGDGLLTGPNITVDSIHLRKISGTDTGDIYIDNMKYPSSGSASSGTAAVQYTGLIGSGSTPASVVFMGFGFETITSASVRDDVMDRVLDYFGLDEFTVDPPTWDYVYRANPADGRAIVEWTAATDTRLPITYNIYASASSGGQTFATPLGSTENLFYDLSGLTNGTPYYIVVRAENSSGVETDNTNEIICTPEANMSSASIYNFDFENGVATRAPGVRAPISGKPSGWVGSGQGFGDKTTDYSVDDSDPYEGSYSALMEVSGTPVNPNDLSIASLLSDNSVAISKDHTYVVSAAVRRSHSQWTRFILFTEGFGLIHTESIDALDDQSGDTDWEIMYFHFRAPANMNAFVRIDSLVTNDRTSSGQVCRMWVDDVNINDMGIETYTDIYNVTPPPPQYGIRNRYFNLGTESEVTTLGGQAYTASNMPKRWGIAMAIDTGSNNAAGYPVWGQESPSGLADTSGEAGIIKAKAANTTAIAYPALSADGVNINATLNPGSRHVLSFDYGAGGTTRPLLRVFIINGDFSHYSSLFVDPGVGIPGNRMWPLTLNYSPAFADSATKVRFDNVTLGAFGSGAHTDETTVYIDNVIMNLVD